MDFRRSRRFAIAALLTLAVLTCGLSSIGRAATAKESKPANPPIGKESAKKPARPETDEYELQRLLVDTIDQVERNYVKGISRRELIEAAIEGMLKKLDPYSTYISPKDIERFRSQVESEYCGIGIQIDVEDGRLVVISPLVGTPAHRAGILAGDHVVAIDGEPTGDITIDAAVRRLKGKVGSKIVLGVLHVGESEPVDISVVRKRIHVDTVLGDSRDANGGWNYMLDKKNRIGYIRVTVFGRETAKELRVAIDKLKKQDLEALILDLRFNPGGLLSSAVAVCDMFVPSGLIVATSGRNVEERKWQAKKADTFTGFPMVVLVNRITASAGEIVAACLQDHQRAVVMGERTWGKGSVQNVISLEHGLSALKLTTASYQRPSGKNIHRFPGAADDDPWGVIPDEGFAVATSTSEMIALIRKQNGRDIADVSDEHKEKEDTDPLIKMALEYLMAELGKK